MAAPLLLGIPLWQWAAGTGVGAGLLGWQYSRPGGTADHLAQFAGPMPPPPPAAMSEEADRQARNLAPRSMVDACSNCEPPPDPDDDSNDPNKVDHVFGDGQLQKHKLEGYLSSFNGDKQAAYRALQSATRQSVGNLPGRFQTIVNSNGYNVTVRGAVVNGTPRISTAFIP